MGINVNIWASGIPALLIVCGTFLFWQLGVNNLNVTMPFLMIAGGTFIWLLLKADDLNRR